MKPTDFYDATLDEIRDYVHAELTNDQIIYILDRYESEYLEAKHDDELDEFNSFLIEQLENQVTL